MRTGTRHDEDRAPFEAYFLTSVERAGRALAAFPIMSESYARALSSAHLAATSSIAGCDARALRGAWSGTARSSRRVTCSSQTPDRMQAVPRRRQRAPACSTGCSRRPRVHCPERARGPDRRGARQCEHTQARGANAKATFSVCEADRSDGGACVSRERRAARLTVGGNAIYRGRACAPDARSSVVGAGENGARGAASGAGTASGRGLAAQGNGSPIRMDLKRLLRPAP